jgi:hypothetical protein
VPEKTTEPRQRCISPNSIHNDEQMRSAHQVRQTVHLNEQCVRKVRSRRDIVTAWSICLFMLFCLNNDRYQQKMRIFSDFRLKNSHRRAIYDAIQIGS